MYKVQHLYIPSYYDINNLLYRSDASVHENYLIIFIYCKIYMYVLSQLCAYYLLFKFLDNRFSSSHTFVILDNINCSSSTDIINFPRYKIFLVSYPHISYFITFRYLINLILFSQAYIFSILPFRHLNFSFSCTN